LYKGRWGGAVYKHSEITVKLENKNFFSFSSMAGFQHRGGKGRGETARVVLSTPVFLCPRVWYWYIMKYWYVM
jgi:hypothetical protein